MWAGFGRHNDKKGQPPRVQGDEADSLSSLSFKSKKTTITDVTMSVIIDVDDLHRNHPGPGPERLFIVEHTPPPPPIRRTTAIRPRPSNPGAFHMGTTIDVDGDEASRCYDTWMARQDPTAPDSIILVPLASLVDETGSVSSIGTGAAEDFIFEASLIRTNVAPEDAVIMSKKKLKLIIVAVTALVLALGVTIMALTNHLNNNGVVADTNSQGSLLTSSSTILKPLSPTNAPSTHDPEADGELTTESLVASSTATLPSSAPSSTESTLPSQAHSSPSTSPSTPSKKPITGLSDLESDSDSEDYYSPRPSTSPTLRRSSSPTIAPSDEEPQSVEAATSNPSSSSPTISLLTALTEFLYEPSQTPSNAPSILPTSRIPPRQFLLRHLHCHPPLNQLQSPPNSLHSRPSHPQRLNPKRYQRSRPW